MTKRGRKYREAAQLVDSERNYTPEEAVDLAKKAARAAFDETVELHMRTSSDTKHADQLIRGVTLLPHGLGKSVRILAFAQGEAVSQAEQAGADYVGADDLIARIEAGWLEFDVAIAIPEIMGKVGKLGRILGRRGLMPNPRTGTVVRSEDLPRAIEEARKGRVEYRMDRTAIIHVPLGKVSFSQRALLDNMATLVDAVVRSRPTGVKGQFIRSAYLTTTMGPSIRLDLPTALSLKVE